MLGSDGSTPGSEPRGNAGAAGAEVVPIPPELRVSAAIRLVGEHAPDPLAAAQRFLDSARDLKLDLALMWGTLDAQRANVDEVCLAVIGSGRTAMMFVSGVRKSTASWLGVARGIGSSASAKRRSGSSIEHAARVASVRCACDHLAKPDARWPRGIRLVQALLEPREREAALALVDAGFLKLGDLAYLRRQIVPGQMPADLAPLAHPEWPRGLRVDSLQDLTTAGMTPSNSDELLCEALNRTYVDTLDCPELCGMRDVSDVLESHRAVGTLDPNLWWLIRDETGPQGCMLFSPCPDLDSVELVYIGVSPTLRRTGLGRRLLGYGLARVHSAMLSPSNKRLRIGGRGGITCAVDTRNAPAMRMYRQMGFQQFALRVPLVLPMRPA